jgi:hypothetical protein
MRRQKSQPSLTPSRGWRISGRRDDGEGRVSIEWLEDGTPVDRYGRTAAEARRHADVVTELAAELVRAST